MLTRLAFFSGAAKAHVEEALTQNLDRGKLDLKVFDEKHAADLKINGHAIGAGNRQCWRSSGDRSG